MSDAWPLPPPTSLGQCLERLPVRARDKFADLKGQVADAIALQSTAQARYAAANVSYGEIVRRRGLAASNRDAEQVARIDAEMAQIRAKLDKLERERERRNQQRASVEQVVSRLENFIRAMFTGAVELHPPPYPDELPARKPGESLSDALARVRSEIMGLQGEIMRIRMAPPPVSEVKHAIEAAVDRLAREGQPRLVVGTDAKIELVWPDEQRFGPVGSVLAAPSGSASKLMAWLHRDRILAELTVDLREAPGAIPSHKRPALIRDLEARVTRGKSSRSAWCCRCKPRDWTWFAGLTPRRGRSCTKRLTRRRRCRWRRSEWEEEMPEFFYRDEHGKPQDADLHNPILEAGDHAAALAISERVRSAAARRGFQAQAFRRGGGRGHVCEGGGMSELSLRLPSGRGRTTAQVSATTAQITRGRGAV
jgi:prefoldin subunit 5